MRRSFILFLFVCLSCMSICSLTYADNDIAIRERIIKGKVIAAGGGVGGVCVTDGRNIVTTDASGRYKLLSNYEAEFVYITLPSGYEISTSNGAAVFYQRLDSKNSRYDFELEVSEKDMSKHRLVLIADPQVYLESELDSVRRAASDIKLLAQDGIETFGVVDGDIIGEISYKPLLMEPVRDALATSNVPFFYVLGNHDMKFSTSRSNDGTRDVFHKIFGPTYYSFNRGRIHYVVLDDIFFLAHGYDYVGYMDEKILRWLEQDLAYVEHGRTVVVCMHIPTWSRAARKGEWGKEEARKIMNNRRALYDILKPYKSHILTAHEHYNENYIPVPNVYEHVHAPLSTLFWQTPWSMDGIPACYFVYEANGDSLMWYLKAVDYSRNRQFRVYKPGEDRHHKEAYTINVWNYGPGWSVKWSENGQAMKDMIQYSGYDESIYDHVSKYSSTYRYKYLGSDITEHLFMAVPSVSGSNVKIEVCDPFGKKYVWESPGVYFD